jgi:hypothetical protein
MFLSSKEKKDGCRGAPAAFPIRTSQSDKKIKTIVQPDK